MQRFLTDNRVAFLFKYIFILKMGKQIIYVIVFKYWQDLTNWPGSEQISNTVFCNENKPGRVYWCIRSPHQIHRGPWQGAGRSATWQDWWQNGIPYTEVVGHLVPLPPHWRPGCGENGMHIQRSEHKKIGTKTPYFFLDYPRPPPPW